MTDTAMQRPVVEAMDALLGSTISVLDDGFIRVVDYMGSDAAIVQAARVSYGEGTKRVQDDEGLIRYLMRHSHTTPFEMCELKLHIRAPMDCWRQWIRHRTANVNEYSTRYSVAIDSAQRTAAGHWRSQSQSNKQGSANYLAGTIGENLTRGERELHDHARRVYQERLTAGVAREQARKDLPLSTYTEAYWKIDLHNLLHFLRLRMDAHAQQEIRSYATAIADGIVAKWVPIAWKAFIDYRMHALSFTVDELNLLRIILGGESSGLRIALSALGWLNWDAKKQAWRPNREREEFLGKVASIYGIVVDLATLTG